MTKIIGRLNSLGIGKESSRGTAVTPGIWVPWMELEYDDQVDLIDNTASIARLEDSDGHALALKYGAVKCSSKIKDKSIGYFLIAALGSVSSSAKSSPNGSVYDHTFSVLQSVSHPAMSLALKGPNDDVVMANAVLDKMKISCKYGEYAMFEAEFLGKAAASASNTVSFSAENDFFSKHLTFKNANAQSGLTAASAVPIRQFSLEIENKAMLEEVLGSNAPNDVLNQVFSIKGSVTLVHNAATYHDFMTAGTFQALRFDFQNTDVTIGSSANPGLQIDLHRASILNYKRKMSQDDIVEESFDFKAHYSLTDSKMITAILTNLQTAY